MAAYYNENDAGAAAWLRELIRAGEIPEGEVDERSIRDVCAADLGGFTECHFFAGIGVWARALRDASCSHDGLAVWTGSCPCQPFSAAGARAGLDDERHLWPDWFWLLRQCRPDRVFAEQVASKDGLSWLDLVSLDLEGEGYAVGASDTCAAGFGAPHARQRLYIVADRLGSRLQRHRRHGDRSDQSRRLAALAPGSAAEGGVIGELANTHGADASAERQQCSGKQRLKSRDGETKPLGDTHSKRHVGRGNCIESDRSGAIERPERLCETGQLADADDPLRWPDSTEGDNADGTEAGRIESTSHSAGNCEDQRPGPVNGVWAGADWIGCTDGKWRPVEAGTLPLAHGVAGRMGLLRGYGNAINLPQATAFIEAADEAIMERRAAA